ncbi:tyrosine-type recombinase/integrase [uncultured Desulfobacter sp.]|uniref:tyrosine-type recombinase/integrase n=1 Tax=uncultured Desulfobacter sp. TaxID=240139 RepID=UPI002AA829EA|nr:tyrosine-type recombinase/integrase [uncultured Desulfobacter sp.]
MTFDKWSFIGTVLPFFGSHDVYALAHSDLDEFIIHRKGQKTKKGTPPKQVSINREIDDIQSYLNWCVTNKKILNNPLKGFKRPKDDREVIAPPTINEINKIIKNAAPHIQRFVIISYYIGARPGPIEIGALKWSKISWDEKKILIRSADKKGIIGRRVNIHETLLIFLRQWYIEDQNKDIPIDNIIHYRGKPVTSIKKAFQRAKERAFQRAKERAFIYRRLRPYDIRHAHVTHQLEEGADIKAVSLNVGHKSPDTTRKVYQHVSGKLQKEAIEKLPSLDTSTLTEIFKKKLG